jgi:hypothetical protein
MADTPTTDPTTDEDPEAPQDLEKLPATPEEPPTPETPAPMVEPHASLSTFAAIKALRPAQQAALATWMKANYHDPEGHYPLANWEGMYADMRAHAPTA